MAGRTERRSGPSSKRGKANSGDRKRHTGGNPSIEQDSSNELVNRDQNTSPAERSSITRDHERNFDLLVDDVPYFIKAAPFDFNGETRYSVCINNGPQHIFTWDSDIKALRAIDDEASILPDSLEKAISQKLQASEIRNKK